ncbi:MAG: YceD family protein [Alphaproteobacteria bacterium]
MTAADPVPEFSRKQALESVGSDGRTQRRLIASVAECAALARRLGLETLHDFVADMTIDRTPGGEIRVAGRIVADVVQACVVTLEPVPAHIDEAFEVRYTTHVNAMPQELVIGPDDDDPPEPLAGDVLDIGELAAQQLALALDPWPRLPDAALPDSVQPDPARDGPFAALAALHGRRFDEDC